MNHSHPQVSHCCEACGQPVDHPLPNDKPVTFGDLTLHRRTLSYHGKMTRLRPAEVKTLREIMHKGRRSSEALIMIAAPDAETGDNTIKVYVTHIRRALEAIGAPFALECEWGWGYELVALAMAA